MKNYPMVVERCRDTGLLVGSIPGFPGAHSQGATLPELQANVAEVVSMLLKDGEPEPGKRMMRWDASSEGA